MSYAGKPQVVSRYILSNLWSDPNRVISICVKSPKVATASTELLLLLEVSQKMTMPTSLHNLTAGGAASLNHRRPRVSASQGVEVEIIDVPFKPISAQDKSWRGPISKETDKEVTLNRMELPILDTYGGQ
jgi:hypothetical protein